jgi:hypothetical protein
LISFASFPITPACDFTVLRIVFAFGRPKRLDAADGQTCMFSFESLYVASRRVIPR